MMAAMSLIERTARVMLEAAGFASRVATPFFVMMSASADPLPVKRELNNRTAIRKADQAAIEANSKLPLSFEARPDNSTAKFVSRGNGYNFYLSSTEAVFQLLDGQSVKRLSRGAALGSPRNAGSPSAVHKLPEPLRDEVASRYVQLTPANTHCSIVKMRLLGANPRARHLKELPGKSNYITGNDPAKWRERIELFKGED